MRSGEHHGVVIAQGSPSGPVSDLPVFPLQQTES
jgi:hypothetical protein